MAVSWKVFCICHRAKLTRMREKGGSEPVFRIPLLHYGVPRFRISSKNTPLHYRVPFLHCPNPFHLSQTAIVLRETDGGREQDANRDNVPMWESQVEQRFILELKERARPEET